MRVEVCPLTVNVSVSVATANGSPACAASSATVRACATTLRRPAGVVRVTSAAIGARMPQRGSPASRVVVTVPSASVMVVTPSSPWTVTLSAPDGSMTRLRTPPPGRYSARKRVSLPRSEVRTTS